MENALVIGGSNGIGLAIALELANKCGHVSVVDRVPADVNLPLNMSYQYTDLLHNDFSFLENYTDIDTLVITAGFGRITPFEQIHPKEIDNSFQVNAIATMRILHYYFRRMQQTVPFYCAVMGSIAGLIVSPLFALYSATKAAVCKGIESLNIELEQSGTANRILNVSPGTIRGTRFYGMGGVMSRKSSCYRK